MRQMSLSILVKFSAFRFGARTFQSFLRLKNLAKPKVENSIKQLFHSLLGMRLLIANCKENFCLSDSKSVLFLKDI